MIYVLAYPSFAPSCAQQIAEFRARHEPLRAALVPPHITLVFGVAEAYLPGIADLVEIATQHRCALSVSFDSYVIEFDPFEKKHKIFLLCGAGREDLTSLHTQLYDGPHRACLSTAHPFQPHMTVASYDRREDAERVDVRHAIKLPIRAQIEALRIVRFAGGELTTLKTAPFLT